MNYPKELFITGTDTGIGKTVVSAMLTQGLEASYWKPVQSGLKDETDTQTVKRMTDLPSSHFKDEVYRLSEPLSPHASAAIDDVKIEMSDFTLPEYNTDHLIVEGAGGVLVPLNDSKMMIDLMAQLQLPVLLVVRSKLGTLNHTFLTLEALRRRDITVRGVIMNGPKNPSNRQTIEEYGHVEVWAEIEPMDKINPATLASAFHHRIEI